MMHRRSRMKRRWGRALDSRRPDEFEVEDVSTELLRESTIDSTSQPSQPGVVNLSPGRATTPRVNSPSIDNETNRPVVIDVVSQPLFESPEISYMPLEIAADLIPRFDGESSSLLQFIKLCRSLDSRVKPSDRGNLLFIIRCKIEGPACLLLANQPEPTTVEDLVGLLKKVYAQSFDSYQIHGELDDLHQGTHETVEFYGARAREILSRGLEAANDDYNSEQIIGAVAFLNQIAVRNFRRGLQNQNLRIVLLSKQDKTLDNVIDVASRLERKAKKLSKPFPSPAELCDVRVVTTDAGSFKCFNCDQEGHYRNNCPRLKWNVQNPLAPERLRCSFCRKTGHSESRCFIKLNWDNTEYRCEAPVLSRII